MELRNLIAGLTIGTSFIPRGVYAQGIDSVLVNIAERVKARPDSIISYPDIFGARSRDYIRYIKGIRWKYTDSCYLSGDGLSFRGYDGKIDPNDSMNARVDSAEVTDIGLDRIPDASRNIPGVDYSAIVYEEDENYAKQEGRWKAEEKKISDWYEMQIKRLGNYYSH